MYVSIMMFYSFVSELFACLAFLDTVPSSLWRNVTCSWFASMSRQQMREMTGHVWQFCAKHVTFENCLVCTILASDFTRVRRKFSCTLLSSLSRHQTIENVTPETDSCAKNENVIVGTFLGRVFKRFGQNSHASCLHQYLTTGFNAYHSNKQPSLFTCCKTNDFGHAMFVNLSS